MTLVLTFISCAKPINQLKDGKMHGKWVDISPYNSVSKGRYKQGVEVVTWKLFMDGKLYKKEKYKGNQAYVTFYYPSRQISSKGKTQYDVSKELMHWYYSGDWLYYNPEGKLTATRKYLKGEQISEQTHH